MEELAAQGLMALLEYLGEFIRKLWDALVLFFKGDVLAPSIFEMINTGIGIYNGLIGNAIDQLTTNPMQWNEAGWGLIVNEVYPAFLVLACPLVAIFSLHEFSSDSSDLRMNGNLRLDRTIPAFFKMSLAQFITVYSIYIIVALFSFVDLLTGGWINRNAMISYNLEFTLSEVVALSGWMTLLTWLLSLVYMGVLIVVAGIILYTSSIRFIKIFALSPFGTLASSTIAGNRELNQTAKQFWKYIIGVVLEAVLMLVILALFAKFQGTLTIASLDGSLRIVGVLLNRILIAVLCLGSIKGAGYWIQRSMGM